MNRTLLPIGMVRPRALAARGLLLAVFSSSFVATAVAEDDSLLALSPTENVLQTTWHDNPSLVLPSSVLPADDQSLAQRVAALEATMRHRGPVEEEEEEEEAGGLKQLAIIAKPTHKLRGRLFTDGIFYDEDDTAFGDRENEFGFDTARLGLQGDIFENVRYIIEVEFEGTEVDLAADGSRVEHVAQVERDTLAAKRATSTRSPVRNR